MKVEHIAPYLPYGVQARFKYDNDKKCRKYVKGTVSVVYSDGSITCFDTVNASPDNYKLLLKPLIHAFSDADFLDEFSENEWERFRDFYFNGANWLDIIGYAQANVLFRKHYDVFGLLEAKLAMEI